jgi:hypothetical protein
VPTLEAYASWRAHPTAVLDLAAVGGCALSVSAGALALHAIGGAPRLSVPAPADGEFTCCCLEPGAAGARALAGTAAAGLVSVDLASGKGAGTFTLGEEPIALLAAPVGRGLVAAGTAYGRVLTADPRARFKAEHNVAAHAGGLTALAVRGDLLATAGLGLRQGRPVADAFVKARRQRRRSIAPPFSCGCGGSPRADTAATAS